MSEQTEFQRLHDRLDELAKGQSEIKVQLAEASTRLVLLQCAKHDSRISGIEDDNRSAGWKVVAALGASVGAFLVAVFNWIIHK